MFQRMKTLRASGMTSTQALEDAEIRRNNAQSDLSAAKSRAAQARQQLQRTLVRAPFDGIVSERKVSNGDTAQIGKELIKVIDPTSMRFEGLVSADKIGVVKVGQPVLFRINGYPGQDFAARYAESILPPTPSRARWQCWSISTTRNSRAWRACMRKGASRRTTVSALMIPDSALVKAGDMTYTWKVKDKALHKVEFAHRRARRAHGPVGSAKRPGQRRHRAAHARFDLQGWAESGIDGRQGRAGRRRGQQQRRRCR